MAIHGYCGVIGVVVCGFVLWGYPSSPHAEYPPITPWGQATGALIMCVLGFIPCYVIAKLLNRKNMLRVPFEVELIGLDHEHLHEEILQAQEVRDSDRDALAQYLSEVNS